MPQIREPLHPTIMIHSNNIPQGKEEDLNKHHLIQCHFECVVLCHYVAGLLIIIV